MRRATKQDINKLIPTSLRRTDFPEAFVAEKSTSSSETKFHVYTASVSPSDTDHHQHMGNDGFMKHCLDAAASAASTFNKSPAFDLPVSLCNIQEFSAVYAGEAMAGDIMNIKCWQHGPYELRYKVTIKSIVVCHCKASFYSSRNSGNGETKLLSDLDSDKTKKGPLMSKL